MRTTPAMCQTNQHACAQVTAKEKQEARRARDEMLDTSRAATLHTLRASGTLPTAVSDSFGPALDGIADSDALLDDLATSAPAEELQADSAVEEAIDDGLDSSGSGLEMSSMSATSTHTVTGAGLGETPPGIMAVLPEAEVC